MLNKKLPEYLLEIGAVVLSPSDPFTWSSGLKSPIYCDNRLTMSYPEIRDAIASGFVELIKAHYPEVEVIAGTATAGIPHAAWVSHKLNLPMVYVRSSAKSHGKKKQIEGKLEKGTKVVLIEDLISTGGSSMTAVDALREEGADVLGVAAIFTYGLSSSYDNFEKSEISWATLSDFETLIEVAVDQKIVNQDQLDQLKLWHQDPQSDAWLQKK